LRQGVGRRRKSRATGSRFWEEQIDKLSAEGLRVLAAAAREVPDSKSQLSLDDLDEDMTFLGLIGIIDPPRPEAIEAIKSCHEAGIRVR
jgi:magnesium-transporting ATPase (P-type)